MEGNQWLIDDAMVPTYNNFCIPIVDGNEYFNKLKEFAVGAIRMFVAVSFGSAHFINDLLAECRVRNTLVLAWRPHGSNPLFKGVLDAPLLAGVADFAFCDSAPDQHHCHHEKTFILEHEGGKFTALTGGIIPSERWISVVEGRHPAMHDVGCLLQGESARDLAVCFAERWNRERKTNPLTLPPTLRGDKVGTSICQIARSLRPGYITPKGEASILSMWFNAIRNARTLIYIEQQHTAHPGLVEELKAALERGVKIIYLRPGLEVAIVKTDISVDPSLRGRTKPEYERVFLDIVPKLENMANFALCGLNGVHVHSKLMIVDDEFTCVGSANLVDLSMDLGDELHSEICVGIHDPAFARAFRMRLFDEHCLGVSNYTFEDFVAAAEARKGILFRMSPSEWGKRIMPFAVRVFESARGGK